MAENSEYSGSKKPIPKKICSAWGVIITKKQTNNYRIFVFQKKMTDVKHGYITLEEKI